MAEQYNSYVANCGCVTFGEVPERAIVIVTGLARSGTSATAELVNGLGVPFFYDHLTNLEHYEFGQLTEAGDVDGLRLFAYTRGDRWAVKKPSVFLCRNVLREAFGDRITWVVPIRDPVGIAIRESMANGGDAEKWLPVAWRQLGELREWLDGETGPRALISFDRLKSDRGAVRDIMRQWLSGERGPGEWKGDQ